MSFPSRFMRRSWMTSRGIERHHPVTWRALMRLPWEHWRGYHEWESTTPVVDALGTVVAVVSVVIGGHAALSLWFAVRDGDAGAAVESGLFFVAIGLANGFVDLLRRWRRHHY